MLTHRQVWTGIDRLAARHGMSASALARHAGLDATVFNKSKRTAPGGKPRWPSTESLSKILEATGANFEEFARMVMDTATGAARGAPLIGFAEAGNAGYFDDSGFPVGAGWDQIQLPGVSDPHAYALEISGDSMIPVFRPGDRIIVSPGASVRPKDRVVVKTKEGEVLVKELKRQTKAALTLGSANPAYEDRVVKTRDIEWVGRVLWVSQ